MGKDNKKWGGPIDWDAMAGSESHDGPATHNNSNGSRGGIQNGRRRDTLPDDRSDGKSFDNQRTPDPDPDFSPYLEVVEEFKAQMIASQKAMKNVHDFFNKQQRDIQNAVETRRRLAEMTERCKDYKTTIKTMRNEEKEKDDALADQIADIEEERNELEKEKEAAVKHKKSLEEEKEKFERRMSAIEAEKKMKLDEERKNLEKEQIEKYETLAKGLEMKMKKGQDEDKKAIAELQARNNKLSQELEKVKIKLKEAESNFKDVSTLKTVYEEKAERLEEELQLAANEFGLNAKTNQFYNGTFLKIWKDIQDICSHYIKEQRVGDLNTLHERIEQEDEEFTSVPISSSKHSAILLGAHAQRVISAQLREIIWQPFSSETTQQDPKYVSLFNQISEGLVKYYGSSYGLRAARLCTALTMRGLESQPPLAQPSSTSRPSTPRPGRAEVFTDNVMDVLSLLVETSLHPNLRGSLHELALSAIRAWDIAQTDEREVIVDINLDLKSLEGWREDIPESQNGVIVLFPRITARSYSRIINTRPVGPPGMWVPEEPEVHIQEACKVIYDGEGLGKWSEVVIEGEKEEEERKLKENQKKLKEKRSKLEEEMKSRLEEEMKKLTDTVVSKRRVSQSRRDSVTGGDSKPSMQWINGGRQQKTINE